MGAVPCTCWAGVIEAIAVMVGGVDLPEARACMVIVALGPGASIMCRPAEAVGCSRLQRAFSWLLGSKGISWLEWVWALKASAG